MKDKLYRNPNLEVRTSTIPNAGYGVFATDEIKKGEIIEECVWTTQKSFKYLTYTDYQYHWDKEEKIYAMVLGVGCIFNSSRDFNVKWSVPKKGEPWTYIACKDIKKDEELFIFYGEKQHSYLESKTKTTDHEDYLKVREMERQENMRKILESRKNKK